MDQTPEQWLERRKWLSDDLCQCGHNICLHGVHTRSCLFLGCPCRWFEDPLRVQALQALIGEE